MFSKELFLENWHATHLGTTRYGDLVQSFIDHVIENHLNPNGRLELASNPETEPSLLALLAFDKSHINRPGDIRLAVAENPSTPTESLEMIIGNEDRMDWTWEDWLDYENDDWSDEVDLVAEYGKDLEDEIRMLSAALAAVNLESRP